MKTFQDESHERVDIKYGAAPNKRPGVGGWLPLLIVNGRSQRAEWAYRGMDLGEAIAAAHALAVEESERYRGDWYITVEALP